MLHRLCKHLDPSIEICNCCVVSKLVAFSQISSHVTIMIFLYKMVYNLENTGLQLTERLKHSFDN